MAKALKTAALIIGAAAAIVVTAGALAPVFTAAALGSIGIAASATAVGAALGLAGAVLSLAAGLAAPKGTLGGSATKFTIDKESGIPYLMGRTGSGGRVVHRQYYGPKDAYESWAVIHSLGPVKSVGPLIIDGAAIAQNGTSVGGSYNGYMWLDTQLGACPEALALAGPQGAFPGWDASSRLSGLAADLWTLKFDTKGKVFPEGVPQRLRVLEGVFVYDPRLDDTYPGGVGPCRIGQEDTYVYSENPALHAITWAFGRYQNDVLIAGGGLGVWGIDMPPFVEWAGICDINKWKVGGTVYTTADNKWDVMKMIAQAGSGEVMASGALLSVIFSAPRVSIGTITSADIAGDLDIPSTASMRDRRNTIIPRIRLESQGWEIVPLDPIIAHAALALDGASRPKEITYPLIQDATQAGQVAMYDLLNAREIDGMVIPAKIYALGYRAGDCLTLDIPEADLIDRDVIIRMREIDGGTMGVTFTCRSEDASKHPFALGQSGVEPRTPDLTTPVRYGVSDRAAHVIVPGTQTVAYPATSTATEIDIAAFTATIDTGDVINFPAGSVSELSAGTLYVVLWQLSTSTYVASPYPAAEMSSTDYVYVNNQSTLMADGSAPEDETPPPGYGGGGNGCPVPEAMILLANETYDGPGVTIAAGQLNPARHWVWAPHEHTGEWAAWRVERTWRFASDIWSVHDRPDTSPSHLWALDGADVTQGWQRMDAIGVRTGTSDVVGITIAEAHTYVLVNDAGDWLVSHNKRASEVD